jgi:hypothetical protein
MNYNKIYNSLIDRAKNRTLEGYKESHHIVPKSIGGSNKADNLVNLTAREHFLAHWLLVKIHPKEFKLLCAWNSFCRTNAPDRVISHHYERCKLLWIAELHKRKLTHPEWWKNYTKHAVGTKWLNKEGENYRASVNELEKLLDEGWNLGRTKHIRRPASEETKTKISKSNTGTKRPTRKKGDERSDAEKEASIKSAIARKGRKMLPEQVVKMKESRKRNNKPIAPRSEEHKQRLRIEKSKIVVCPHCGKEGQMIIMGRWHFDKCKKNPTNVL